MNIYEQTVIALLGVMERRGIEAGQLLHELDTDGFTSLMIAVTESPSVKEAAERLLRNEFKQR